MPGSLDRWLLTACCSLLTDSTQKARCRQTPGEEEDRMKKLQRMGLSFAKLYAHQAAMRWTTQPKTPADPIHETPVTNSQIIPIIILPLYICPSPGISKLNMPASKGSLIVAKVPPQFNYERVVGLFQKFVNFGAAKVSCSISVSGSRKAF